MFPPLTVHPLRAAVLAWLVLAAVVQARAQVAGPAGEAAKPPSPKLNLIKELNQDFFGNTLEAEGKQVTLSGSFTVTTGQRRGILTLSAQIAPGWHVFSLD